ncbi:MAG: DUF2808 domain-containing protein [Timaviella obliquedivisa GSE-PSE-MK23-08B]|jgi:hypothetical protein|nr:DUF2808 domain-containing protein [Timaviella obliquedivisa GSE-PSE-MK23-08B]
MSRQKSSLICLFSGLAAVGCLLTGLPTASLAQGLPGLTIFSGVDRENQLGYRLDFGGEISRTDRYRLRIPQRKMTLAASEFIVAYPDTYTGKFDPDEVEVKVDGEEIALESVNWDQENRVIEIYPQESVAADTRVEIILSDVQNPRRIGTHYFNALVRSPGDVPLNRYLGTWILSIGND